MTVSVGSDGKLVGGARTVQLPANLRSDVAPEESEIAISDTGGAFGLAAPLRIAVPQQPAPVGAQAGHRLMSESLSDRIDVGVNIADGALVVHNDDVHIAGTGDQDFDLRRYYNSRLAGLGVTGQFGIGASAGLDASLAISAAAVDLSTGDGTTYRFALENGSYRAYDLNAELSVSGGRFYDVVYRASGARWSFDSGASGAASARLVATKDRYGNAVQITRNADGTISRVTDPQGRQSTFTSDPASHHLTAITDFAGRAWRCVYGTGAQSDQLQSYTDPAGDTTTYGFDASNRLTSVTTPAGRVTRFTYDTQGRVKSLIRTTDEAHATGPTTTFVYGSGAPCATQDNKTVVSDPLATGSNGHTTTYCTDTRQQITKEGVRLTV